MHQLNFNGKKRYKELDALRGIAALMVVLFHFTMGREEARLGFKLGVTGVDLFFMISGFVILLSLNNVKNAKDFVINRISRLYPTYWACVTFTFLILIFSSLFRAGDLSQIDFIQYLGNMSMFQFYLRIPNLDGPYWTMIIEIIFYLGMLFLYHFKILKYLNFIGITLSLSLVIITSCFFDLYFIKKIFFEVPLLQFIPLFFAGTVFNKIIITKSKFVENYIILIICLIAQILLFNYSGRSKYIINQLEYSLMLTIYFSLFALFVHGKLFFIVSKTTLFLGKISFALYLIHQKISIGCIIPILVNKLKINFWIASLFITLPTVICLATLITYYIEIPIGKQMKEKLRTTI